MVHSMLSDGVRLKPTLTGMGTVDENNVVGDDFSLIAIDMNPDEFKKKLSGITEYANRLYKDINSRIDALSKKMETYAGLLNDEFKN